MLKLDQKSEIPNFPGNIILATAGLRSQECVYVICFGLAESEPLQLQQAVYITQKYISEALLELSVFGGSLLASHACV